MSLIKLPKDIIIHEILDFFISNKEAISLMTTCKTLWNMAKKYGYIRKLTLGYQLGNLDYVNHFISNTNTLNSVLIQTQMDPHNWIFKSPRMIECDRCVLSEPYTPVDKHPNTEIFIFRNLNSSFWIDWKMFPKLTKIVISAKEIKTTNVDSLKNLRYAYISTIKKGVTIYTHGKKEILEKLKKNLGEVEKKSKK